jgi:NMD protein affecting ribosome stability and mRNA decay
VWNYDGRNRVIFFILINVIVQQRCVICGRGSDKVLIYKGVCLDCFLHETKMFIFKERNVHFTLCPVCGDHIFKGKWRRSDDPVMLESDLKAIILSNIRVNINGEIVGFEFKGDVIKFITNPGNRKIDVGVKVKLHDYGVVVERDIYTYVNIEHKLCDRCLNEISGNYEAILQVRGNISREEMNRLYLTVSKSLEAAYKSGRDYRLIDQKEVNNGVDFYFSSYNEAVRAAKELKKQFGGNIRETRKLVKVKGGRRITRHTLLLRITED